MITQYLNAQTKRTSVFFNFNSIFYVFVQLINIVLCSMNIIAYQTNPLFQNVLIAMLVLSTGIMIYGLSYFIRFRDINNFSSSLVSLIDKQLNFIKIRHEIWMILISISILILIFNINIIVDYDGGYYPIYNKQLYVIINVGILLFIYAVQKVASISMNSSLKSYLNDLRSGVLEESLVAEKNRKRYKMLFIVFSIICTILLLYGVYRFIQF